MTRAAFFRNLNHGHRGSPTGAQLVEAFGGPDVARAFQTNGTVLYDGRQETLDIARERLGALGFRHEVVVRSLPEIVAATGLVDESEVGEDVYRVILSFFDTDALPALELPMRTPNGLVEIRRLAPGVAASYTWRRGTSVGDVTGLLERLLCVPVTSRTLGTVQRLAKAAG
jgi:hypothetical protein